MRLSGTHWPLVHGTSTRLRRWRTGASFRNGEVKEEGSRVKETNLECFPEIGRRNKPGAANQGLVHVVGVLSDLEDLCANFADLKLRRGLPVPEGHGRFVDAVLQGLVDEMSLRSGISGQPIGTSANRIGISMGSRTRRIQWGYPKTHLWGPVCPPLPS